MSSELSKKMKAVRRAVRVRERTLLVTAIQYVCSCGMQFRVQIAKGVAAPDAHRASSSIPAPMEIPCLHCDDRAKYVPGSIEEFAGGLSIEEPYLRVPSRRAAAHLADAGRFEAQLVIPEKRAPDGSL